MIGCNTGVETDFRPETALRVATTDDIEYVRKRWQGYFGGDRHEIRPFLQDILDGDHMGAVLIAEHDGQRIGCAIAEANDAELIANHTLGLPEHVRATGTAAYLNFACVTTPYRGMGLHHTMVAHRVRNLAPHVDRFYTLSWLRQGQADSVHTFGGRWDLVDYLEGYYGWEESDRGYCPDCGGTCECDAILWQLDAGDVPEVYG